MPIEYEKLPLSIQEQIGQKQAKIDEIGMSNANILLYEDMVLKVEAHQAESNHEHTMLGWLADKLPVPEVLLSIQEQEFSYLLMSRAKGEFACSDYWLSHPQQLVKILAQCLKMLWAVPIQNCPYDLSLNHKLKIAEQNVLHKKYSIEDAEVGTYGDSGFQSPEALLSWLNEHRPKEDLVFSHGDFCLPNIFIDQENISALIDLGRSGIADRYQDIALCYRSLKHNFSGVYSGIAYPDFNPDILFDELGMPPDYDKIRYYILLDELF